MKPKENKIILEPQLVHIANKQLDKMNVDEKMNLFIEGILENNVFFRFVKFWGF